MRSDDDQDSETNRGEIEIGESWKRERKNGGEGAAPPLTAAATVIHHPRKTSPSQLFPIFVGKRAEQKTFHLTRFRF
ncbi:hypothetical protein HanIR_Chr04g0201301 [Helianthus annuus]|nr:hypothetical protein HanIR_Chr04g0201301 [Helianthus annuus]